MSDKVDGPHRASGTKPQRSSVCQRLKEPLRLWVRETRKVTVGHLQQHLRVIYSTRNSQCSIEPVNGFQHLLSGPHQSDDTERNNYASDTNESC